tara:strand:- start:244 stop:423 length:180 start_codon:yes stop_codon:yes gene_type:complete
VSKFKREEKDIENANGKDAFNVSYYFTKEYKERFDACIKELRKTAKLKQNKEGKDGKNI